MTPIPQTPTPTPAAPIAATPAPTPTGSAWTVQASGVEPVPNGSYFAEFVGVVPFANEKVADKMRWQWRVLTGPQTGKVLSALTDAKLTTGNHAGRLVSGMAGRDLVAGEDVSALLDTFKGKKFLATVAAGPRGGKPSVQCATLPPEM